MTALTAAGQGERERVMQKQAEIGAVTGNARSAKPPTLRVGAIASSAGLLGTLGVEAWEDAAEVEGAVAALAVVMREVCCTARPEGVTSRVMTEAQGTTRRMWRNSVRA